MACKNAKCNSTCDSSSSPSAPPLPAAISAVTDQVLINNPTAAIKIHALNFDSLYSSYNALRKLAMPLNGLQQSDPIPPSVKIKAVKIEYEVDGEPGIAVVSDVIFVGELAPLIGPALKKFIAEMRSELNVLDSVTTAVKAVVGNSTPQSVSLAQPD
jgi:hypothetical protein